MSHDHDAEKKFEVATHALLPVIVMLFIEMAVNHYFAPQNMIFISPYLLAFFTAVFITVFVLWKGQICLGQRGRLTFVLKFLLVFALGNFAYTFAFTPKHSPLLLVGVISLLLPAIYWQKVDDDKFYTTMLYCALGLALVGMLQYLAVYWVEIPSLLNGVRANNFAQILLGILLAGWYLMLAKSRLDVFFKLLIQLALIVLVMNYIWTIFVLYQQLQIMPDLSLTPYFIYFVVQFVIFALLAWLLLGKGEKQIKNPTGWSAVTFLTMLYPLTTVA